MLGLVVSPGNIPGPGDLQSLQPPALRSILYRVSDCAALGATGRPYCATVNNECAEVRGWTNWEGAIRQIASHPTPPTWVEIGNEFDLFWQDNEADVPPAFAADLIRRASPILRDHGLLVVAPSVAGRRWPEYLKQLADLCREQVDYFNIHPYGQRPTGWGTAPWMFGELMQTMIAAHNLAGRPMMATEIGVKIRDAGSEEAVASWMQAADATWANLGDRVGPAFWFAYRDQVGAPAERGLDAFGLLRENGTIRPAFIAYAALPKRGGPPVARFVVGDGVYQQMERFNDEPASDEIYHPIGAAAGHHQYSETFGMSGRRYVYVFAANKTFTYFPETSS